MNSATSHGHRGFTIIEMMIALLLSLLLLAGVGQVYVSSKQSYRVAENVARLQENSRFAMNIVTREIRMAGFSPCPPTEEVAVTLDPGLSADSLNFSASTSSSWSNWRRRYNISLRFKFSSR